MTETAQSIILTARPSGSPTPDNFRLVEHPVPEPAEGQFLVRVLWLSLDPYMRALMEAPTPYAPAVEVGGPMIGGAVGVVVASRHPGYAPGDHVTGFFGWTTHAVSDGSDARRIDPEAAPLAAHLGVLGLPGHTAWISLNRIAAAQPGETILISAASGAVGSVLGQLAKVRGLTTIGMAGGAEKCAHATEELGYEACIDYRAAPDAAALTAAIAAAAPQGIDIYHDNTGGKPLLAALPVLKDHARIALCGFIAWYDEEKWDRDTMPLAAMWASILFKRLVVRGFLVTDHADSFEAFLDEVGPLVAEGRVQLRETVADGLASAPEAFLSLFRGGNQGKQLVRVATST